jgi:hypothetical protein
VRRAATVLLLAVAALAVVVLLFTVVFPRVDRAFVNDPVLEQPDPPASP